MTDTRCSPVTWEVEIRVNGESHLTIGSNHLAGDPNVNEEIVEKCARHLLSFIGRPTPEMQERIAELQYEAGMYKSLYENALSAVAATPRYIVDGLPVLPDDDADFTPYLARKIIAKYQELLRGAAQAAPDREAIAKIIYDAFPFEARLGTPHKPAWSNFDQIEECKKPTFRVGCEFKHPFCEENGAVASLILLQERK